MRLTKKIFGSDFTFSDELPSEIDAAKSELTSLIGYNGAIFVTVWTAVFWLLRL